MLHVIHRAKDRLGLGRVAPIVVAALLLVGAGERLARASERLGVSICTLIEGVPGKGHPVRKAPRFAAGFAALDRAGQDRARNARAHQQLVRALDQLWTDAERVFKRPPARADGSPGAFANAPAQGFLQAWVLSKNAPLVVGLERFEPSVELAAALAVAGCRADRLGAVLSLTRGLTANDAGSLRAVAALLLVEDGKLDEARELAPTFGDHGFIAAFAAAELEPDPDKRRMLHARAGERVSNADQTEAWRRQDRRLAP